MPDPTGYPGTPRWVKVSGLLALVLLILFFVVHLSGHGPGAHGHSPQSHMPVREGSTEKETRP